MATSRSTKSTSARGTGGKAPAKRAAAKNLVRHDALQPAPVVLVTGAEGVLADRAVAAVLARARAEDPDTSVERLDAAAVEGGRLAVVTSPSLFGGRPVVVVDALENSSEGLAADLLAYLRAPAPDVCLVLRHGGGVKGKALLEAARATGAPEADCSPLTKDDEKLALVVEEVRGAGARIEQAAARALVEALGSDLRELLAAARHLAEMTGLRDDAGAAAAIGVDAVDLWFGGRIEVTAFKVADAAVAGRADQALGLVRHAVATGADPVPLVAALAMKVRTLAKVSDAGRGRSADLAPGLGMAPWQMDRARRDLAGWSEDGLATAVLAVARADADVKGASRDPLYAVERAVLTICGARD